MRSTVTRETFIPRGAGQHGGAVVTYPINPRLYNDLRRRGFTPFEAIVRCASCSDADRDTAFRYTLDALSFGVRTGRINVLDLAGLEDARGAAVRDTLARAMRLVREAMRDGDRGAGWLEVITPAVSRLRRHRRPA